MLGNRAIYDVFIKVGTIFRVNIEKAIWENVNNMLKSQEGKRKRLSFPFSGYNYA